MVPDSLKWVMTFIVLWTSFGIASAAIFPSKYNKYLDPFTYIFAALAVTSSIIFIWMG